jgi:DNA-binding beta-propeller fold protein YncE
VFVTDSQNYRIQKFTADGIYIDSWGTFGTGNGQFDRPRGIAFDINTGNVYVTDYDNNRIQIFTNDGDYVATIP